MTDIETVITDLGHEVTRLTAENDTLRAERDRIRVDMGRVSDLCESKDIRIADLEAALEAQSDFPRNQEAVDWARKEVQKVIQWCREVEDDRREQGDEVHAMRYRVAANIMHMKLTSTGCVISPFSERGPEFRRYTVSEATS